MDNDEYPNDCLNLSANEIENFMLLIVRNGHLPVSVQEIDNARIVHQLDDCPTGEEILKSVSSPDRVPCLREIYLNLGFSDNEIKHAEDLVLNRYRSSLKRSFKPDSETEKVVTDFFGLLRRAEDALHRTGR